MIVPSERLEGMLYDAKSDGVYLRLSGDDYRYGWHLNLLHQNAPEGFVAITSVSHTRELAYIEKSAVADKMLLEVAKRLSEVVKLISEVDKVLNA